MNRKMLKKAALCVALGACLGGLAVPSALAQSVTGAVAGRASAGDTITITNTATGLTRSVTVGRDGSYRIGQLPPGDYRMQVNRDGRGDAEPREVNVSLGGTTTVNLGGSEGAVTLDSVQVVGARIVNRVDVYSTESSFNINREELSRMPVAQSLDSVAMLAPGVVGGNSSFGGISFGGSSVAENAIFVNGLNVTDIYDRQGYSAPPFAFFKEFQVKTGGYSVEFGRSTGGVINAVTRSGSNEFEGGMQATFEPSAWQSRGRDHYHPGSTTDGHFASRDASSFMKTNLWASGPLVKDRLFLFAMYEDRDNRSRYTSGQNGWGTGKTGDGFWGGKLDWNITDNHTLELLAFSDDSETKTKSYEYDWASARVGDLTGTGTSESGGTNWSATYTGHFGQNFTAKAMIGQNERKANTRAGGDDICDFITSNSTYSSVLASMPNKTLGCAPQRGVDDMKNTRDAARLDFEWALGDHLLRFGADREVLTTKQISRYSGSGTMYTAYVPTPGSEVFGGAGVYIPAGVTEMLMGRYNVSGGEFETVSNAFYIEDQWNVTPNLLLTLGVRSDSFNNKVADGSSFIKQDNLIAPRGGFSWDIKGDGSTKLFGNAGRYYLPVSNNINVNFAGGLTDEYSYFVLDGWSEQVNPVTGSRYMAPIFGPQIGPTDTSMNTGSGDLRQSVSRDIDPVYQDEFILGFQSMINQAWSWGVNATYRRMHHVVDDVLINHTPCGPTGRNLWVIGNGGENMTIWGDPSIGCATEGWITIDTSKDGYIKGGSNEVVGYKKPKRTYKAVEFQIDRAWDDKWMFNASYLWSKNEGNLEGPVNSDTNFGSTGMVQHYDHPAVNERYGVLFNDFRHQFKFRAGYQINEQWSVGSTLQVQSGGPITAFGVTWPDDSLAAGSFATEGSGGGSGWLCKAQCGSWDTRELEYSPRGAFGRLPWTWNMGANVTWRLPVDGVDLSARLSVYNLFNNQTVINVHQRYEAAPGQMRDTFGTGTRWQSPRYTQLVVTWNF
ncbi:TonB-dependent receptor [Stenotrophomonas mori]|uniref:TonB-dependent receptor n=1 Tax=Stenotrophomonas mori TaxID=2871096 RepID=A0ABT0SJI7_9GAMM|nr:TonB-dependent receptor [Stenotrophomonas mori]MCL7715500.1 TonB-dependent receptor [Stenotrophomonas mori]